MVNNNTLHITAILGSVHPDSYTSKALQLAIDELDSHGNFTTTLIDPGTINLPFPGQQESADTQTIKETVINSMGVILATPEYHGGFSSVIKLVIENLGFPSVLSGKPVALLGVASGQIGAIKSLEQLRSVCSHVGAIVLPGPVSVPNVQKVFDAEGKCLDQSVEKRIRRLSTDLMEYINNNICPSHALEEMVRQKASS